MDSLLTLALLTEAGGPVLALHAHFLPPGDTARELAQTLDRLCRGLGVAFHAVDLSEPFRQRVTEPFVAAYASGLTPNPCAACNRDMKFGLLFEEAERLGATGLATGHYARISAGADAGPGSSPGAERGAEPDDADGPHAGRGLYRGLDPAKDQSYFLSLVPREALGRAVFPLGAWRKADVPAALAARGLAPPLPGESQEVCFVPGDDYRAFLQAQNIPLSGPGPAVLENGRTIGSHLGLWRYTIGQRRGLNLPWSEPLYVLDKREAENTLVVGPKERLATFECRAAGLNLLLEPSLWPQTVLAQTCYRQRALPATARVEDGRLSLRFHTAIPKPTPGQVAAVYDASGRVLAGGIIRSPADSGPGHDAAAPESSPRIIP